MDDGYAPVPEYRNITRGAEPRREETSSGAKLAFLSFTSTLYHKGVDRVWRRVVWSYKRRQSYRKHIVESLEGTTLERKPPEKYGKADVVANHLQRLCPILQRM